MIGGAVDLREGTCVGVDGWTERSKARQLKDCQACPVRMACLEWVLGIEAAEAKEAAANSGKSPIASLGFLRVAGGPLYGGLERAERANILATRLGESPADLEDGRLDPGEYEACGSYSGYANHVRLGERACDRCRTKQRDYQRAYRAARKAESG